MTVNARSSKCSTSDSESDSNGIRVQVGTGKASVAAGIINLSLRDLQRLVRVILGNIRARAKLNLLSIPQPRDLESAMLQRIGGGVTVQSDVTAHGDRLVRGRHNYSCLLCISANTQTHIQTHSAT